MKLLTEIIFLNKSFRFWMRYDRIHLFLAIYDISKTALDLERTCCQLILDMNQFWFSTASSLSQFQLKSWQINEKPTWTLKYGIHFKLGCCVMRGVSIFKSNQIIIHPKQHLQTITIMFFFFISVHRVSGLLWLVQYQNKLTLDYYLKLMHYLPLYFSITGGTGAERYYTRKL